MSEVEIAKKVKKGGKWISILLWVVILILVLLIIFFSFFSLARTVGSSMENTLQRGQHTLLFRNRRARNGEIIVFRHTNTHNIKRVIASGGDRLVLSECETSGRIYIFLYNNGEFLRLDEDYLCESNKYDTSRMFSNGRFSRDFLFSAPYISKSNTLDHVQVPESYIITVPDNQFFVLGDNRNNSVDSRRDGFVDRRDIVGRVRIVVMQDSFLERVLLLFFGRGLDETAAA